MSNIEKVKCCTCGYEWFKGMDGSHSCSTELLKKIERLEKIKEAAEKVVDFEWGDNDDDAVETITALREALNT